MRFGEILDAADQLSIEEQETLVNVLRRRVVEERYRQQIAEMYAQAEASGPVHSSEEGT